MASIRPKQKIPGVPAGAVGCRIQDPGSRGYRWWKTADFSHSARCAPAIIPDCLPKPFWGSAPPPPTTRCLSGPEATAQLQGDWIDKCSGQNRSTEGQENPKKKEVQAPLAPSTQRKALPKYCPYVSVFEGTRCRTTNSVSSHSYYKSSNLHQHCLAPRHGSQSLSLQTPPPLFHTPPTICGQNTKCAEPQANVSVGASQEATHHFLGQHVLDQLLALSGRPCRSKIRLNEPKIGKNL